MNKTHRLILDAVINKAKTKAYEAVDIIGVYGSVASGDCYEKSDLDLLILINGDEGRVLSESFIIQDSDIGYDIYCTTWEMLEADSTCTHPHLSKLLDSKICYSKSEEVLQKLYSLRETTLKRLKSDSRTERSAAELDNAKICFANCFLETEIHALRTCMAEVIYHILNAIMLFNGSYFKRGTKRTFDEVSELKLPFDIKGLIMQTILSETADEIRENLKILVKTVSLYLTVKNEKQPPTNENISGTYEEMYSNWRNKMHEAATYDDIYSSFINTASLGQMLSDIHQGVETDTIRVFESFNPHNTQENAYLFNSYLDKFLSEYKKANIEPRIYENIDKFLKEYNK